MGRSRSGSPGPASKDGLLRTTDAFGDVAAGSKVVLSDQGSSTRPPQQGSERPGRFRVIEELGRGGMGAVERVEDTIGGNEVALKRLLVNAKDGESSARLVALFEREYHTLSQLNHPRIIKVFDYGVDKLGPYYTMELLDGRDLRKQAPLGWREMCRIGRDVASSLAILHARRIVHRDVTPANIRCGDNGYAKLIDFGAMTLMGEVKEVVGTAPFIAPEALQAGVLDGRADLFALGVTLYLSVSGRLPYSERKISRLRDAWRSQVPALKELCPDVPDGFNALVMELLSISPLGRPQSAALVFERLSTIGELSRDEALEVAGAYLSVPNLTGRAGPLGRCRSWLIKARRGRGGSVVVSSKEGMGRSRLLDSIVLEAKLLGAIVVRADRSHTGEFGVLRRLATNLVEAQPRALPEDPELRAFMGGAGPSAGRDRLVGGLNAWLLKCAAKWPTVLIVDDAHAIDGPSLAALGALAVETRKCSLLVVCASTDGALCRAPSALALLKDSSRHLPLEPLTDHETRSLLASMFSEADNLDVLASVLHRHARGNPALTIQGAQALVDAAKLRYASGAWDLPAEAEVLRAALPKEAGLDTRLSALSADALQLALVTALDVHDATGLPDYGALLDGRDAPSVHSILQDLTRAGILTEGSLRFSLARESYRTDLPAACSVSERRAAHRRLAAWFEAKERPPAAAYHLTRAEDWEGALALVATTCLDTETGGTWAFELTVIDTFERLLSTYDARESAPGCLLALRSRYLKLCAERDEWARMLPHVPLVLAGLKERCGLVDYADLHDLPEGERLSTAIARAEARHAGVEGGMSLLQALTELPGAVMTGATTAMLALDVELARTLPSLEPLFALSPAFSLIERLGKGIVACCLGRVDIALAAIRGVYGELQTDSMEGVTEASQALLRRFALGFIQGIEASMGRPEVLERADPGTNRSPKIMARERYAYYVAIGDVELATAARRKLERLEIAGGAQRTFPTSWDTEYGNYSLTNNLQGLKRCERQAMQVAERMPNWGVRVELARVAQALCGRSTEATLQRTMELCDQTTWGTSEGRYALFLRFEALFGLGRYEECRTLMQQCLDRLGRPCDWFDAFEVFAARTEAALGQHELARQRALRYNQMYKNSGVRGVLVGRTYEELARIGILIGDVPLFRDNAERCAAEYKCGYNPTLTTRYERLIREAKAHRISVTDDLAEAAAFPERNPVSELMEVFSTQLSTCLDTDDRLRTLLSLAVERSGASGGFLYVARADGLAMVASQGFQQHPESLDAEVDLYWKIETEGGDMATETGFDMPGSTDVGSAMEHGGQGLTPLLLSDCNWQAPRGCGVLILAAPKEVALRHDLHVTAAITLLMMQDDDVVSMALV